MGGAVGHDGASGLGKAGGPGRMGVHDPLDSLEVSVNLKVGIRIGGRLQLTIDNFTL